MRAEILFYEWLKNQECIKIRTYNRYKDIIEMHVLPSFKGREIDSISRREIQDLLTREKLEGNTKNGEKLSSSSANLILCVINLAFEYACDMEYLSANPCDRIKRIRSESKKVEAYSIEEQKAIEFVISESYDTRLHGILICLYTGLRIGELLGLTWSDVDFERGVISVNKTTYRDKDESGIYKRYIDTPKTTSSDRIIPMTPYISQLLYIDMMNSKSKFVVENKKGEQMSTRSYQYIFERLTERAGVRKLNFHALRHTFATRAIECGMDIKTVADVMGHKNASITLNRYAHCMIDHKVQMMQKLPRVL